MRLTGMSGSLVNTSTHALMSETDRVQFVRDYMADLRYTLQLEAEIGTIYSDPTIINAEETTTALRHERDILLDEACFRLGEDAPEVIACEGLEFNPDGKASL